MNQIRDFRDIYDAKILVWRNGSEDNYYTLPGWYPYIGWNAAYAVIYVNRLFRVPFV